MNAMINLSKLDLGVSLNVASLSNFENLWVILLIIPLFFIILFLIRKEFVKIEGVRKNRSLRLYVFFSRLLIFLLVLIAIASPYTEKEKVVKGDPYIKILVDNSSSFSLFERGVGEKLESELEKHIGVNLEYVGTGDMSDLGDGILRNLEENANLLLVSDGNNNHGADLGDVALYAARLNASVNALNLEPVNKDVSIRIVGPNKVTAGVENTFTIKLSRAGDKNPKYVKVTLDNDKIIDQVISGDEISFTKTFNEGYHRFVAVLDDKDYFEQNNVYYKTVKVVKKPEILFYTERDSPLVNLLQQVYNVNVVNSLGGADLSKYHAIVVNDIHSTDLDPQISTLSDYISDGNGLFVAGGSRSFDYGNYKGSVSETLMPVFVATAGKKEGDVNVVVLVDISGSTGGKIHGKLAVDIEKALAVSILDTIGKDNRVGIAAFDTDGYLVEPLGFLREKNRVELDGKIKTLVHGGGTMISSGITTATNMLRNAPGNKNIVLISDGRTQSENLAKSAVKKAADLGVKVYAVGVGDRTNRGMMKDLASIGDGIYFEADDSNKLKILFGEPDNEKKEEYGVTLLDKNHFITEDLEINAQVSGFNAVVPKSSARLLATTDSGDPILTSWRFGLGRIVALSTDDGSQWGGGLLEKDGSRLITRAMNWVIGDPDRKSETFVSIDDTKINEPVEVLYKGSQQPIAENVVFYKVGNDLYSASIIPTNLGFNTILGAVFAVNYDDEYEEVGLNDGLAGIVSLTNGKMFDKDDIQGIVEQARTLSRRVVFGKVYYRWPFVLFAIFLFLLEIFIKKWMESRYKQEIKYEHR